MANEIQCTIPCVTRLKCRLILAETRDDMMRGEYYDQIGENIFGWENCLKIIHETRDALSTNHVSNANAGFFTSFSFHVSKLEVLFQDGVSATSIQKRIANLSWNWIDDDHRSNMATPVNATPVTMWTYTVLIKYAQTTSLTYTYIVEWSSTHAVDVNPICCQQCRCVFFARQS